MKKIIVFMPAYNAEKTIISVLERFPKSAVKRVSETLILDNDSHDRTYGKAMEYKKREKIKNITILKNRKNLGYGGSKKKAFRYAIDRGYDIFVMVHSDGQYPPEKIADMVRPIEEGKADLVIGSRVNAIKGGMKLWKVFGNRALTMLENIVFGLNLHELHSGYKAYNVHALEKIPIDALDNDHIISSQTIALFKLKKFKIKEILIPTYYSKEITECSFNTSLKYGIDVIKLVMLYILYKMGLNLNRRLFA